MEIIAHFHYPMKDPQRVFSPEQAIHRRSGPSDPSICTFLPPSRSCETDQLWLQHRQHRYSARFPTAGCRVEGEWFGWQESWVLKLGRKWWHSTLPAILTITFSHLKMDSLENSSLPFGHTTALFSRWFQVG